MENESIITEKVNAQPTLECIGNFAKFKKEFIAIIQECIDADFKVIIGDDYDRAQLRKLQSFVLDKNSEQNYIDEAIDYIDEMGVESVESIIQLLHCKINILDNRIHYFIDFDCFMTCADKYDIIINESADTITSNLPYNYPRLRHIFYNYNAEEYACDINALASKYNIFKALEHLSVNEFYRHKGHISERVYSQWFSKGGGSLISSGYCKDIPEYNANPFHIITVDDIKSAVQNKCIKSYGSACYTHIFAIETVEPIYFTSDQSSHYNINVFVYSLI